MSFYEFIIIIRQDISASEVEKISSDFINVIEQNNGKLIKKEYWGLRQLAYEISNNRKGNYYFMGIEADNNTIDQINKKLKFSESVIRSSLVKVDKIEEGLSEILKTDEASEKIAEIKTSFSSEDDKNSIVQKTEKTNNI
jgi:small subunit ribosomal protein S6